MKPCNLYFAFFIWYFYIYLKILKLHFFEIPHNSDTELILSDLSPIT